MGIQRVGADGWIREDLTDQVDGQTTVFTTTYKFQRGTLEVAVNGLDQGPSSFVFVEQDDDQSFVYSDMVLRPPDKLTVRYLPQQ